MSAFMGYAAWLAGAIQEGELVRQPTYATTCVKLDRALVWDGQGYVIHRAIWSFPA
jgi:hypothetical protein